MKTIKNEMNFLVLLMTSLFLILSCSDDDNGAPETEWNEPQQETIDIGTHKLETYSQINNSDYLVVFESGLGNGHSVWFQGNILEEIGDLSDVLLYDRAGYENSEVGPGPRTIEKLSFELETVVNEYLNGRKLIFVCHSLGGLIVRDYAIKHPENVASILFIDPSHESYNNPGQDGEDFLYNLLLDAFGENHGAPMEVRELIEDIEYASTLPTLPNVPITVITSMKEDQANMDADAINGGSRQTWYNAHAELGQDISDFTHLSTENSGHYIMLEEPNIVIEQIEILLTK